MCPMCGGSPKLLGGFGSNVWFRCCDCGWDWSAPASEVALEDEDAVEIEEEEVA